MKITFNDQQYNSIDERITPSSKPKSVLPIESVKSIRMSPGIKPYIKQSPSYSQKHESADRQQSSTIKALKPILKTGSRNEIPYRTSYESFSRKHSFTSQPQQNDLFEAQKQPKTLRFQFSSAPDIHSSLQPDQKPRPFSYERLLNGTGQIQYEQSKQLSPEMTSENKQDRASEYVTELEGQVIKMRTDNEIMGITLRHL